VPSGRTAPGISVTAQWSFLARPLLFDQFDDFIHALPRVPEYLRTRKPQDRVAGDYDRALSRFVMSGLLLGPFMKIMAIDTLWLD
jgi:hypothetical protein